MRPRCGKTFTAKCLLHVKGNRESYEINKSLSRFSCFLNFSVLDSLFSLLPSLSSTSLPTHSISFHSLYFTFVSLSCLFLSRPTDNDTSPSDQQHLLQLSLQFSGFRVKARHLGHRFEEKAFMYQEL